MEDRKHSFPSEPAAPDAELSRTDGTASGPGDAVDADGREARSAPHGESAGETRAEAGAQIEANSRSRRRAGSDAESTAASGDEAAREQGAEGEAASGGEVERSGSGALDETEAVAEQMRALDSETLVEIKKRAEERDRLREELLRAKADLDNYQKRVRRERPNWEGQAVRQLLLEILPVVDNFERALSAASETSDAESLRQGVEMIYVLLTKTLAENGVEEIEALGETFDPQVHEAVAEVEVEEGETGSIVDVHQKGYTHKGVVVRPSRVTVARKVTKESS